MIVKLDSLVEGANIENLPVLEDYIRNYKRPPIADGDDNPKLFARKLLCSDYLVEAAKYWRDQVVVDLGCGRTLDGYIVSKIAGARAYVGVEPYNVRKFYQRLTDPQEKKGGKEMEETILPKVRSFIQTIEKYDPETVSRIINGIDDHLNGKTIPVAVITEDMLSALRRFPDDSVSLLTAGMDYCIIWRGNYAEQVVPEIERVLDPKGAYLSFCSRFVPPGLVRDVCFEGDFKKFTKPKSKAF